MTAAHRMKGVGWFVSCVIVTLVFYLVSLQVAAERGRLDAMNARIAGAERDIRALETEFDTRANLAQLERWNGDTLALTAPVAAQFVADETALAAIDVTAAPPTPIDGAPVQTAALLVPSLAGVSLQAAVVPPAPTVAPAAPQPAFVRAASLRPAPAPVPVPVHRAVVAAVSRPVIASTPKAKASLLRAVAVANVRPQAVAMLDRKLLSDSTLGDIVSTARAEADRRR